MVLFDTFDTNDTFNMWTNSSGAPIASCGSAHGTKAFKFAGSSALDRFIASPRLDVDSGGQWQFFLKYASDEAGMDCPAVQRAVVTFYYSLDGGITWVPIQTFRKETYL